MGRLFNTIIKTHTPRKFRRIERGILWIAGDRDDSSKITIEDMLDKIFTQLLFRNTNNQMRNYLLWTLEYCTLKCCQNISTLIYP